jgi:hypothetical protein
MTRQPELSRGGVGGGNARGFDDDIMLVAMMKRLWNVGREVRTGWWQWLFGR